MTLEEAEQLLEDVNECDVNSAEREDQIAEATEIVKQHHKEQ